MSPATRPETLPFQDALALIQSALGPQFLNANLSTVADETQLQLGKTERLTITPALRPPADLSHDRAPQRWVDPRAPWLRALGVTDSHGKVREKMSAKFRQIERFVDLLASAFRESALSATPAAPVTLCDMGSGKGYLTFAAHDYLARIEHRCATVTGIEARPDLVTLCNRVALENRCAGLHFIRSAISEFPLPPVNILVALHACDLATDDALFAGLRAGAEIILAAPCCHKEARPQLDRAAPSGPLRDVLRHGIFAGRHAEIATDSLRVLLLERAGYRVRVSEFIAAEHTAKNVMLLAAKRPGPAPAPEPWDHRIAALKELYGLEHHRLEQLLLG